MSKMTKTKWNELDSAFKDVDTNQILDNVLMKEYETIVLALKCLYDNSPDEEKENIASISRKYENLCLGLCFVMDRLYSKEEPKEFEWNYLDKS